MLCAISMTVPPWLMITKHDNKIHSMPSLWLLPFVSTVVASALAGLIGPRMNTQFQEMYINIIGCAAAASFSAFFLASRHRRDASSQSALARGFGTVPVTQTSCGAWACLRRHV